MSDQEHTQGEWKALGNLVFCNSRTIINTRSGVTDEIDQPEAEANARLISKAPEMLELLKKYNDFIQGNSEYLEVEFEEIEKLLTSIKGEQEEDHSNDRPKCGGDNYVNRLVGDESFKMCTECGYTCGE